MERGLLKHLLCAGPSRCFDVRFFTNKIDDPQAERLFSCSILNSAILLKKVEADNYRHGEDIKPVSTLIYLPYDNKRPQDGGESLIFREIDMIKYLRYKLSGIAAGTLNVEGDLAKLRVLDGLPTFSPFIMDLAFEREQIAIPEGYLQLTPGLRNKLTAHLKGRLRPLIVAAYSRSRSNIEKAVEDLTNKLFYMRCINEILPLVEALRLRPETAEEVMTAWIGIAYFEYEYSTLQHSLKGCAGWLAKHGQPRELGRQDKDYVASLVLPIRNKIRSDWNEIVSISAAYRSSYDAVVFNGRMDPFIQFLGQVRQNYWQMGSILGRLEQTVLVWKHFTHGDPERRMSTSRLVDLLSLLRDLLLTSASVTEKLPGRIAAQT